MNGAGRSDAKQKMSEEKINIGYFHLYVESIKYLNKVVRKRETL